MKQGRKISNRGSRRTPGSSGFSEGSDLARRGQELWAEAAVVGSEIAARALLSRILVVLKLGHGRGADRILLRAIVCQKLHVRSGLSSGH